MPEDVELDYWTSDVADADQLAPWARRVLGALDGAEKYRLSLPLKNR